MMKKRILSLMLAMMMLGACARAQLVSRPAEETKPDTPEATSVDSGEELYDILLPLVDERVSADLTAQEPELGGAYLGFRPVTSQMNDEGDAIIIIGDLYRAKAQVYTLSPAEYGKAQWLDRRAVVILRRDQSATPGWSLEDITYDEQLQMEDAVSRYFADTMSSWVSDEGECSLQYPAVFGVLKPSKDSDGCTGVSAALPDGTASFFIGSRANTDQTLSTMDEAMRQKNPTAEFTRNDASGVLRVTSLSADGARVTADYFIVTGPAVYHAVMSWDASLNADYLRYSDYVMNSFCADELGIG